MNNIYAGFWKRALAILIDDVILTVLIYILIYIRILPFVSVFVSLVVLFYFVLMESSPLQATLGKLMLGIKVVDGAGKRISFLRALLRNIAKSVSYILFIGYLMAAFTKKKQGLHDLLSGCLVINKDAEQFISKEAGYNRKIEVSSMDYRLGLSPLMEAVIDGDNQKIRALAASSVNINEVNPATGTSALWMAASFGNLEAVKTLIECGGDLTNKNKEGISVKESARQRGYDDIVRLIEEHQFKSY